VNAVILSGIVAVVLALVAYTVGIVAASRRQRASAFVLGVFSLAVLFDLAATGCMMAGSDKPWFTLHGTVGWVALIVMLVAVARLWMLRRKGPDTEIPGGLLGFLRVAYVLWLIAFAIGAALAGKR